MKKFLKKYKEILIVFLILIVLLFLKLARDNVVKKENNESLTIEKLYEYGEKIAKDDNLSPNTEVAIVEGEKIYKYNVDRYQYSINYNNLDSKQNALYELIKQEVLIKKYADEDYFDKRQELYEKDIENAKNMSEEEYKKILEIYGISEEEKWTTDEELKNIIMQDLMRTQLYGSTLSEVIDKAIENEENFNDQEYLSKLEELKKMDEENRFEGKSELILELEDLYIERIILNSNIEFCIK